MPGGIGTFDEFFDLLTLKQLNRHNKPIFLFNPNHFFEPLLALFKHGIDNNTINPEHLNLFTEVTDPEKLVKILELSNFKGTKKLDNAQ